MVLNFFPQVYIKKLIGSKVFISYPKCGRTWILNVLLNYWKFDKNKDDIPADYHLNLQSNIGINFSRDTRISFTHGGRLKDIRLHHVLCERTLADFKGLPAVLLIRNPVSVLVSYYHHLLRGDLSRHSWKSLDEFIKSKEGVLAFSNYHNIVSRIAIDEENCLILRYEDLHHHNLNRMAQFHCLIEFLFGAVNNDALLQAVKVCEPSALRDRAMSRNPTRIRLAKVNAVDDELTDDLKYYIIDELRRTLNSDAAQVFKQYLL